MVKAETKTSNGKAKTAAERQKSYRERRAKEIGEQRINTWVSARAFEVLSSLAVRYGVTQKVMLERLILKEDDGLVVTTVRRSGRGVTLVPGSDGGVTQLQISLWEEPVIQLASKGRKPKAAG